MKYRVQIEAEVELPDEPEALRRLAQKVVVEYDSPEEDVQVYVSHPDGLAIDLAFGALAGGNWQNVVSNIVQSATLQEVETN
jgi:hypothetical protein